MRQKYTKRSGTDVVAIRLDLDTDGLQYRKWGDLQTCKKGDWLVDNAGEVYSVDAESFTRTYVPTGKGTYRKNAPVWAEQMTTAGSIRTKEGITHYEAGDFLVSNEESGDDAYAIKASDFEAMYERAE